MAHSQPRRLHSVKTERLKISFPTPVGKLAPHVYLYQGIGCLRNEIDTRLDQKAARQCSAQAPVLI